MFVSTDISGILAAFLLPFFFTENYLNLTFKNSESGYKKHQILVMIYEFSKKEKTK